MGIMGMYSLGRGKKGKSEEMSGWRGAYFGADFDLRFICAV